MPVLAPILTPDRPAERGDGSRVNRRTSTPTTMAPPAAPRLGASQTWAVGDRAQIDGSTCGADGAHE